MQIGVPTRDVIVPVARVDVHPLAPVAEPARAVVNEIDLPQPDSGAPYRRFEPSLEPGSILTAERAEQRLTAKGKAGGKLAWGTLALERIYPTGGHDFRLILFAFPEIERRLPVDTLSGQSHCAAHGRIGARFQNMSNPGFPASRSAYSSDDSDWSAQQYLDTYYREVVLGDERRVLAFQLDALASERTAFGRALEYGCGPTLHRAIAAARYAFRIDMADRAPDNLWQIRHWLQAGAGDTDWNRFTRFILEHERGWVTSGAIARRETRTRAVIRELLLSDARRQHPLGAEREGFYDLLISGFCIDAVSSDMRVWRACMGNVLSTLRSGGLLVLHALHRCSAYRVGDGLFPCARLTADDLFASLLANGIRRPSIEIELADCPENARYGYTGILMARGRRR
jgi:hypothetical protein